HRFVRDSWHFASNARHCRQVEERTSVCWLLRCRRLETDLFFSSRALPATPQTARVDFKKIFHTGPFISRSNGKTYACRRAHSSPPNQTASKCYHGYSQRSACSRCVDEFLGQSRSADRREKGNVTTANGHSAQGWSEMLPRASGAGPCRIG